MNLIRKNPVLLLAVLIGASLASAQSPATGTGDASLAAFHPLPAPRSARLLLRRGDRLAICGDSITEQRKYSRIMEDYLTMCVPQLEISVRQYGWSGERAPGFLARMTNDCLRFHPTIATTCYGMNDHEYRPYEERIGRTYRESSAAIIESFKANGARVVEGSPGCVGKMPAWVKTANGTVQDLNLNLCQLRNIGIELAKREKVAFADVFWPMLTGGAEARREYGTNYAISGKDGVHPGWAGHTVMAYAFLKALGLKGDIAAITLYPAKNRATVSAGHKLISAGGGEFVIQSDRYPFCPCVEEGAGNGDYPVCGQDDVARDDSIRSGMGLVPFNQALNRFMLVARGLSPGAYQLTWGTDSKTFTSAQLGAGINLAAEFPHNPFSKAFARVDAAVAAKQAFETRQIKQFFRSPEAKTNMASVVEWTEKERAPLVEAVKAAFTPVTHTIKLVRLEQ